jgi:hypothetical protein
VLATSFGLDHVRECRDLLSFETDCSDRSFVDDDITCGEFEDRPCNCGGDTQNSFQHLLDLLGPACD